MSHGWTGCGTGASAIAVTWATQVPTLRVRDLSESSRPECGRPRQHDVAVDPAPPPC